MEVGAWATALRTSALVGTSRRAPAHAPAGLGTPPEETELLLDQAALFDVLSRGGARAIQGRPTEPAPPETRPYAPPEAQRLLGLLLHQSPVSGELRDDLILGWLLACARHNAILGPSLVPELAALALRDTSMRQPLSNCWGERGRWLASMFHPRLVASTVASRDALQETVPPEDVEELVRSWPTLDRAAASIELRRLRNTDPDRGRDLLAAHWAKLPAKAREEHLTVLGEAMTLADEDFLEAALDDRAKAVRSQASSLLRRLPGSRLMHRMGERLAPLIQVEKRMLRPTKIRLILPQGVDEAGVRDGLAAPDPTVTGQAPYWLKFLIRSSPLDVWSQVSGMKPRDVVAALDLSPSDREAFELMIGDSGDSEWADAVAGETRDADVVAAMSPAVRERWLADNLGRHEQAPQIITETLRRLPRPWSPDVTERVLRRLGDSQDESRLVYLFDGILIAGLGPGTVPLIRELLARPVKDRDNQAKVRAKLLTILQFHTLRDSILDAFITAKETP